MSCLGPSNLRSSPATASFPPFPDRTSKFYGPSVTTISPIVQPWIKLFVDQLKMEFNSDMGEDFYLFHTGTDLGRNMSSSLWTQTVKQVHAALLVCLLFSFPPLSTLRRSSFLAGLQEVVSQQHRDTSKAAAKVREPESTP